MSGYSTNGLVAAVPPLTGNETIAADTNLPAGQTPESEAISVNQLTAYTRSVGASGVTFRNLLNGGDFTTNPFQRGTSFTGITNAITYTADRFFAIGGASSSISVSRQANTTVTGFSQALQWGRADSNANTSAIKLGQVLETNRSVALQGQTVILSFYAAAGAGFSSASSALSVNIYTGTSTNDSAANMVTSSWAGQATANTTTTVTLTTTMTRYFIVGTIPATATQVGILFSYTPVGTATNDYVQFEGIQLEVANPGATQANASTYATTFEKKDPAIELALCQRYYWQILEPANVTTIYGNGMISASNVQLIAIPLPVQMRTVPTVTVTAGTLAFNIAGTPTAVGGGFAASTTQQVNMINITGTVNATAGQATQLQAGNSTGGGKVTASAEF